MEASFRSVQKILKFYFVLTGKFEIFGQYAKYSFSVLKNRLDLSPTMIILQTYITEDGSFNLSLNWFF